MMFHKAGFMKCVGLTLAAVLIAASSVACGKQASETPEAGEQVAQMTEAGLAIVIGMNTVDGVVKNAKGNYFFMDEVPGFDVAVTGPVSGGDATSLIGKAVRVKGMFNKDLPNLIVAQSIEIKESETQLTNVYTSSDPAGPADFFNQKDRDAYPALELKNINKSEDWEGKGKAKVYGALVPGEPALISVMGTDGKEIGKVIVDSMTNIASFYTEKLHMFDKMWFYLNVKESVDRRLRAKNKEMFHADVVFIGLY